MQQARAALALGLLLAMHGAVAATTAQVAAPAPPPAAPVAAVAGTGDAWVDAQLADVDRYGARYRDAFIDEVVRYHAAPRDLVTDLVVDRRWSPGEVYYACALAQVIGRPCRYVADAWTRDRAGGWAALAGRLGVEPGSAPFLRIKRGFVASYRRWARPLALDAQLQREFPRHAGAAKAAEPGKDRPARAGTDAVDRGGDRPGSANGRGDRRGGASDRGGDGRGDAND